MGKLTLYGTDISPPVRAVLLTLKALDIPYEFVEVNLHAKEQYSPEFVKKNPQHTVPVLEVDGQFVWDSHAIIAYLANKYGKSDELYPKDFFQRAVVDQRLHFETGVVFERTLRNIIALIVAQNKTVIPKEEANKIHEVFGYVEKFLTGHTYVAGDHLTIADFSLVTTVTSLTSFIDIDSAKYPKIDAWIKRLEQLPYYAEANGKGLALIKGFFKSKNLTIEQ